MRWLEAGRIQSGSSRVVEPELDMNRERRRSPAAALARLFEALRWLTPSGQAMGPPMRSVGRELEEAFPSRDG
jgi:hypothetical protein